MQQEQKWFRLGVLGCLVDQAPGRLGRTAMMKLAYLLQTVKGLPLGYDFRLYTYGPFDSDLLNDLGSAETLGAVKSQMVTFNSGYGYEFTPGTRGEYVRQKTEGELSKHSPAIRWVLDGFGGRSAAELELLTTIIYADREAAQRTKELAPEELAREVREVKPRFPEAYVHKKIEELRKMGLLIALPATESAR